MRIVLTGGGTGGHVMPFEPIVESLRTRFLEERDALPARLDPEELNITFMGVADETTRQFFDRVDVPVTHIPSGKMRRYASALTIPDLLFRLPLGICKAIVHLWRVMPDVVVSKGGYGSIPIGIAAIIYRIPILIHESDTIPGSANAKLMPFAAGITVGFQETTEYVKKWSYKMFVTGTPVRSDIHLSDQVGAKRMLDFPVEERLLLVMGGSQGAQQINETLLKVLPKLIVDVAILHITGKSHYESVSTVAKEIINHSPRKHLYRAVPYLDEKMTYALSAADCIVSRAGAGSIAEIASLRKPSLLIPYEHAAGDHQRKNAQAFEAAGAAIVLDPSNLGENIFLQNVLRVMTDEESRALMVKNLAGLDRPQAARDIASLAFKLAQGFAPQRKKQ